MPTRFNRVLKMEKKFSPRLLCTFMLAILVISACASVPTGQRIDSIPMYGQPEIARPDFLLKLDQQFIREVVAGIGTRENASEMWWAQAEKFMAQENLDLAMRRYNQSWLLNPNNFKAYWGFGRVLLERGETDLAIVQLEKAIALCTDDFQRPALLTDTGSAYLAKANNFVGEEKREFFRKADSLFEQALKIDPGYGNAYKRWAISLHRQEKYSEAWIKVAEARKQPDLTISPKFLKALESIMPEPK